jgi:hypothetical protein
MKEEKILIFKHIDITTHVCGKTSWALTTAKPPHSELRWNERSKKKISAHPCICNDTLIPSNIASSSDWLDFQYIVR